MLSSATEKAQKRVFWSFVFLLALVAVFVSANDPSARAVSAAFAAILGVPFLLLSLFDLGRALKSEDNAGPRTSRLVWLLSQLQAAFGAVCMAAAAFTVYHNVLAWPVTPTAGGRALLAVFVVGGLLMVVAGFSFIHSAFARGRKSSAGKDDV